MSPVSTMPALAVRHLPADLRREAFYPRPLLFDPQDQPALGDVCDEPEFEEDHE